MHVAQGSPSSGFSLFGSDLCFYVLFFPSSPPARGLLPLASVGRRCSPRQRGLVSPRPRRTSPPNIHWAHTDGEITLGRQGGHRHQRGTTTSHPVHSQSHSEEHTVVFLPRPMDFSTSGDRKMSSASPRNRKCWVWGKCW